MIARVLAPDAHAEGQTLALAADEAAHLGRVLRLRAGDAVRVFDGRGHEWRAIVASARGAAVTVTLGAPAAPAAEPPRRYTLAPAVLKGDGTDDVIRDAVMLGAARLMPFVAARSETRLATVRRGERSARWQRIAVAAAKQCGRAVVPAIDPVVDFGAVVTAAADEVRLLLVEPALAADARPITSVPPPAAVTLAIGPEGGWTEAEVADARRLGWTAVRLGARTVRAAAMALVALAACQAVWDEGR